MASSSSSSSSWTYDVFLSFRGEDTRRGFTSHLYNALRQSGIQVFKDDSGLERGEEISASLLAAIERSRIALVIFSPDYASSPWCMDELVKIMERGITTSQIVIPIFYKVNPSDVRHQRGTYGESMERHQQRFGWDDGKVERWKTALKKAANLSGWHTEVGPDENVFIDNIVEDVSNKLVVGQLFVAEHPVGIESRVHELTIEWSQRRSQKVLIIGLWGMGGIGKTTIAKAIYNEIGRQFRARSFIENIRDANNLLKLQMQLISDITKTQVFKTPNIDKGKRIIQERFPNIKAFVVLDDVDSIDQLKTFCGSHEWFCPGSVIIITTRDLHLLNVIRADQKYEMREMKATDALKLFSWHAFNQEDPIESFTELSKNVVSYCGGLPLALEVLGSFLFDRDIEKWEDVLSKLKRIPNKDIHTKLKISYDGLNDYLEKEIFLDICCFFINKDKNYVTQILDGCGLHSKNGLQILVERSLVKVGRNNKLEMHDLLQAMGKEIIRGNPPKDPEEYSRLWLHENVLDVLKGPPYTGTKAIEGISLKMPGAHGACDIDSKAFKKINKLRLLQVDYVNIKGDYNHLSKKLRWLCWHGFPLKSIPDSLYQEKLVAIDFKYSNLKRVWKKPQFLQCLTILILSHSPYLRQTPDFTKLPNLEKLVLKDCPSLMLVHQSIGDLKKLVLVNLKDCKCLRVLPRGIYKLKSLKTLILSGCSLIDHLEEDVEQMESMMVLKADNTAITTIPKSIARLEALQHGYVSFPGHEGRAQDVFPSLIRSWMSPNNIPQSHSEEIVQTISSLLSTVVQNGSFHGISPFLGNLAKLQGVWEECRTQFRFKGKMARLLDALYETDFMELQSTRETPQISCMEASASSKGHDQVHISRPGDSYNFLLVQMGVCEKASLLKDRIVQGWNYVGWDDSYLAGDQYPDWFLYMGEGRSVMLKVPQVIGCHLKAILLNVAYSSCIDNTRPQSLINVMIINYTTATVELHHGDSISFNEDADWQSVISSVQPGDIVELIILSMCCRFLVKKIAAYLIYDGSKRRRLLK